MSEETTATPSPEPMSEVDRLIGVLFDPKPAFADIAARPVRWWVPFLLFIVLAASITYVFGQRVGWESFFRQQAATNRQFQEMPAEQRERIIGQQAGFMNRFGPVFPVFTSSIGILVIAGAFLFVFNVLVGSELTFRHSIAVTCYGLLPFAVSSVAALALLFLKDPADFDLENPVASNIGAFLDPNTFPRWAVGLGSSIDLFSAWSLILLATGFAAAGRRLSWGRAFTWVMITWAVYVGVKTGFAVIFS